MQEQIDRRDEKIEELNLKVSQFEILVDGQEKNHEDAMAKVKDENSTLKKELEFMSHE